MLSTLYKLRRTIASNRKGSWLLCRAVLTTTTRPRHLRTLQSIHTPPIPTVRPTSPPFTLILYAFLTLSTTLLGSLTTFSNTPSSCLAAFLTSSPSPSPFKLR